jgi:hypothetical protein
MTEKRQRKRYIVENMGIEGKVLFTTRVKVHDISIGGACISLEKKLVMGSEYVFETGYDNEYVKIRGAVIWEKIIDSRKTSRGDVVPLYKVGIRFRDVVSEKGNELARIISKISGESELRLTGTRMKFSSELKGILSYPGECQVKKLGLGGMLIDLDHQLAANQKLPMEVVFPEEEEPVRFVGRVTSCHRAAGEAPARYEIGVGFLEMSERDRTRVKAFIGLLEGINK